MNWRYKPGLRMVKTGVAVLLCLAASILLHRENAFYSCIAAVICMQPTTEKSLHVGIHRFIGILCGGFVGFLLLEASRLIPQYYTWAYVLVIPVFLLLAIYLTNLLGRRESAAICCIVFLNIATNLDRGIQNSLLYVADRVIDTGIGIVLAVLVNRFLFPRHDDGGGKEPAPPSGEGTPPAEK